MFSEENIVPILTRTRTKEWRNEFDKNNDGNYENVEKFSWIKNMAAYKGCCSFTPGDNKAGEALFFFRFRKVSKTAGNKNFGLGLRKSRSLSVLARVYGVLNVKLGNFLRAAGGARSCGVLTRNFAHHRDLFYGSSLQQAKDLL